MVKFIMNNTESTNAKKLIQQVNDRGLLYSKSTIECVHCKVIFPIEYGKCPQCEIDNLWHTIKIQFKNNFGGK